MCILCNTESLRLLVAPLESLSYPQLAEAIQTAREAAMQFVLDTADTLHEFDSPDAAVRSVGPDAYDRYIVERADQDGVAATDEVRDWSAALRAGTALEDPRVQSFLASSTEGLATYVAQIREKQTILERFLEIPAGAAPFAGIGPSGEIVFEYGEQEKIYVLTDDEAMQIAVDWISGELWREDPALLLRYSNLPEDAVDLLASAQRNPEDKANDILAGIIDVSALAADAVRQGGYGRFVADGVTNDFEEHRFGDVLIVRLHLSDAPHDEF